MLCNKCQHTATIDDKTDQCHIKHNHYDKSNKYIMCIYNIAIIAFLVTKVWNMNIYIAPHKWHPSALKMTPCVYLPYPWRFRLTKNLGLFSYKFSVGNSIWHKLTEPGGGGFGEPTYVASYFCQLTMSICIRKVLQLWSSYGWTFFLKSWISQW